MKVFVMAAVTGGALALLPSVRSLESRPTGPSLSDIVAPESLPPAKPHTPRKASGTGSVISNAGLTQMVRQTCAASCHSDQRKLGSLTLEHFDVAAAASDGANAEIAEKMIRKLRAGMMPPPGRRRPGGDYPHGARSTLESLIDKAAALKPEPGVRTFQRLNRAEYERSIKALLDLDVDAGDLAAARHQERQLRQHRRRADAVADAARRVPRRRERDQPARGGRPEGQRRFARPTRSPRLALAVGPRRGRADRHARRHLRRRTRSRPTASTSSRSRCTRSRRDSSSGPTRRSTSSIEISIDGERVGLLDVDRVDVAGRSERHGAQDDAGAGARGRASRLGGVRPARSTGR